MTSTIPCPKCQSSDWHPDPVDEDREMWVCEACGYMEDDKGDEIKMPEIKPIPLTSEEEKEMEDAIEKWAISQPSIWTKRR